MERRGKRNVLCWQWYLWWQRDDHGLASRPANESAYLLI